MDNLFSSFAALQNLAARYGDGLKPELLDLAYRDATLVQQGAVPLPVKQHTSGPGHQCRVATALNGPNVVRFPSDPSRCAFDETG